tara:strand:+ start:274 stop:471 length:198 start_codon:yes stop_codon:yes gene_type:complete
MKKLNGQEAWFLKEGLQVLLKTWSEDIIESERKGKNSIFTVGYLDLMVNEITKTVDALTLKKYKS